MSWDFSTGEHWHHRLTGTEAYIRQTFVEPGFTGPFTVFNQFNTAGFEEQSS